jgi:hypothetical protein
MDGQNQGTLLRTRKCCVPLFLERSNDLILPESGEKPMRKTDLFDSSYIESGVEPMRGDSSVMLIGCETDFNGQIIIQELVSWDDVR